MPQEKILVVEDDKDILELITYNLEQEGYKVRTQTSGEGCLQQVRREKPDLLLLDLMLPGMDGLDICKLLKRDPETESLPIIMVTAKGEESDIVLGLELGADDYVTKPFSPKVLVTRIRAVLRRRRSAEPDSDAAVTYKDLHIDPARHVAKVQDESLSLTATEFGVLHFLARRPGRVYTREQIVDAVKGEDYAVTERAVDVQMVGLRKKLGPCATYIETVRGVGYRFKE